MLIGNAPCSWGVYYSDSGRISAEGYLDQVAAAGYRGTELGPFGFLPNEPSALAVALAARGLTLVGAAHVHTFGDPAAAPALTAALREIAALLRALDAPHLVIMDESSCYPPEGSRELDADGWRRMTATLTEARAMLAGDYGVALTFHPHVGTCVELEPQIDRLLAATDLDLCFDTGHHAFWGQDPLAYMARVRDRIGYMHLKNVDPAICARVRAGSLGIDEAFARGAMCPLPDGSVDIPGVMRFLRDTGFDGPVVVEQDLNETAAERPAALARRNFDYISALA
jgi:inosose dehydratase